MGRRLAVTILVGVTAAVGCSSSSKTKTITRYDWSSGSEQLREESIKAATKQCVTDKERADSRVAKVCIKREAQATFSAELPKRRTTELARLCDETHATFVQLTFVDFQQHRITQAFDCP